MRYAFLMASFSVVVATAVAQDDASSSDQETRVPETRIDIRISPAIDFHFFVRAIAEKRTSYPKTGAFGGTVAAVKELNEQLGSRWGRVEGTLYECDTFADIRESYADFPESFESRGPGPTRTVPIRSLALALADAMTQEESNFQMFVWPAHSGPLKRDAERIASDFTPKQAECIAYMLKHLGIEDPKVTVPMYLVHDAPFPGAFTHRRRGGGAVCFIASQYASMAGSLLYETILHESTHALDIASRGESVFGDIRDRLVEGGISRRDKLYRDVPHTLMFIHAGETIRRNVDPKHVHYGDAAGYYKKAPLATRAIRPTWIKYLDGKITRDAAVDKIVKRVLFEHKNPD